MINIKNIKILISRIQNKYNYRNNSEENNFIIFYKINFYSLKIVIKMDKLQTIN